LNAGRAPGYCIGVGKAQRSVEIGLVVERCGNVIPAFSPATMASAYLRRLRNDPAFYAVESERVDLARLLRPETLAGLASLHGSVRG